MLFHYAQFVKKEKRKWNGGLYNKYCSKKCSALENSAFKDAEKIKNAIYNKYGVYNVLSLKETHEKQREQNYYVTVMKIIVIKKNLLKLVLKDMVVNVQHKIKKLDKNKRKHYLVDMAGILIRSKYLRQCKKDMG